MLGPMGPNIEHRTQHKSALYDMEQEPALTCNQEAYWQGWKRTAQMNIFKTIFLTARPHKLPRDKYTPNSNIIWGTGPQCIPKLQLFQKI